MTSRPCETPPSFEPSWWMRDRINEHLAVTCGDPILEYYYGHRLIDWRPGAVLDAWVYGARRLEHPRMQARPCDRCGTRARSVRGLVVVGAACGGPHGIVRRGPATVLCATCLDREGVELGVAAEVDFERLTSRVVVR